MWTLTAKMTQKSMLPVEEVLHSEVKLYITELVGMCAIFMIWILLLKSWDGRYSDSFLKRLVQNLYKNEDYL